MTAPEPIISIAADVTVYPSSDEATATYAFNIPATVWNALEFKDYNTGEFVRIHIVIRDLCTVIFNGMVDIKSGHEVAMKQFGDKWKKDLYPRQRIRIEVFKEPFLTIKE